MVLPRDGQIINLGKEPIVARDFVRTVATSIHHKIQAECLIPFLQLRLQRSLFTQAAARDAQLAGRQFVRITFGLEGPQTNRFVQRREERGEKISDSNLHVTWERKPRGHGGTRIKKDLDRINRIHKMMRSELINQSCSSCESCLSLPPAPRLPVVNKAKDNAS